MTDRYSLNFNATAASLLNGSTRIAFKETKGNRFLPGTKTIVTTNTDGVDSVAFFPKERGVINGRHGATVSKKIARKIGIKTKNRYTLKRTGHAGSYWLVPHSSVGAKTRKFDEPIITVSLFKSS